MKVQDSYNVCHWIKGYKAKVRKTKYATYLSIVIPIAKLANFQSGDKLLFHQGLEMGRPIFVYYLDKKKHTPPEIENCKWLEDHESIIRKHKATFYILIERGIARNFKFEHGDSIYYYRGIDERKRYLVKIYMDKKDKFGGVENGNQKNVSTDGS